MKDTTKRPNMNKGTETKDLAAIIPRLDSLTNTVAGIADSVGKLTYGLVALEERIPEQPMNELAQLDQAIGQYHLLLDERRETDEEVLAHEKRCGAAEQKCLEAYLALKKRFMSVRNTLVKGVLLSLEEDESELVKHFGQLYEEPSVEQH